MGIRIGALRGRRGTCPPGTPSFLVVREKWAAKRCTFSLLLSDFNQHAHHLNGDLVAPPLAANLVGPDADLWLRVLFGLSLDFGCLVDAVVAQSQSAACQ